MYPGINREAAKKVFARVGPLRPPELSSHVKIPEILIVQCITKSQVKVMGWNPGVYIFLFNNMLGKKIIERGWKKGGKCIFIPQLVKSMHIFSLIDLNLQNCKKRLKIFVCGAHRLIIINFNLGQYIMQSRGGGVGKMNLKFNIHPCYNLEWPFYLLFFDFRFLNFYWILF